jgi:hypothetical protein
MVWCGVSWCPNLIITQRATQAHTYLDRAEYFFEIVSVKKKVNKKRGGGGPTTS